MSNTRATPEQVAIVRQLYTEHVPMTVIQARTGLTSRQVYYICRDLPKHGRPQWDCREIKTHVATMTRDLGKPPTYEQIGKSLGICKQAAHALLAKCGIAKPRATVLSLGARIKRQTGDARKAKQHRAMLARKTTRDTRIIALRKSGKTQAQIAERLKLHINTVGRVLRSAGAK